MNKVSNLIVLALLALLIGACASTTAEFGDDWTIADFFQAGQAAYFDQGNANLALAYYEEIFQRFPDSPRLVEADYEMGFVLYKDGKKETAAEHFQKVLSYYPNPDLAQWPKVLAEKLLANIED